VTITIHADGGKLQNGSFMLHVPPKQQKATVAMGKVPEGLQQRRCGCGAMIAEGKLGSEAQTVAVQVIITPSEAGQLVMKDVVQASGKLKGLTYPRVSVEPAQEVVRTEATSVTYVGDLVFTVRPK